jgi:3-phosphoshikimate 1-carboxyvinyltransferase
VTLGSLLIGYTSRLTPSASSDTVVIRPARGVQGMLRLPGDKSISHRYAMLGALAEGETRLENFSTGQDCASTLRCLRELGCQWERSQQGRVQTVVLRGGRLRAPERALDCGNSGSTMRMLAGILAGQEFASELRGDASLSRRPMARIMRPLMAMGAEISSGEHDRPPLRIRGGKLRGMEYTMPSASAQVKSCLLFAGLLAEGETQVEEPVRTRDHGELALRAFGAEVERRQNVVRIRGGQKLRGIEAAVPGDLSSAAFFLCAAALFPGSELSIAGLGMNPTRARLLDILIQMGARLTVTMLEEHHGELIGTLQVQGQRLTGATIRGADTAALIDEIPVLAAIAPFTEEGIEVRDAAELRMKESDRIAAVAQNLRALGAEVEEFDDGLRVPGGQTLHGGVITTQDDHRIAMAFAVAALRATSEVQIPGAQCADISFPGFYELLDSVLVR